jgi:hypothetical protein
MRKDERLSGRALAPALKDDVDAAIEARMRHNLTQGAPP